MELAGHGHTNLHDSTADKSHNMSGTVSKLHTRHAQAKDAEHLIVLANEVQAALTKSGSLQQIGPLSQTEIEQASIHQHCFLLLIEEFHPGHKILGCAFVKHLASESDVSIELGALGIATVSQLSAPWLYLHSVMLHPASQGLGIGRNLVHDFVRALEQQNAEDGATVLLNCWAGNEKLRFFYASVGFSFLAVIPKHDFEVAVFHQQLSRV